MRRFAREIGVAFREVVGELGEEFTASAAPRMVLVWARAEAEQLMRLTSRSRLDRKELARLFLHAFAERCGVEVTFPIKLKARLVK